MGVLHAVGSEGFSDFCFCLFSPCLWPRKLLRATPDTPTIAQLQQQIADAKGSADNAWMLVCSALVLLMTGPGLALFYGGLVRKKNVLGDHDAVASP